MQNYKGKYSFVNYSTDNVHPSTHRHQTHTPIYKESNIFGADGLLYQVWLLEYGKTAVQLSGATTMKTSNRSPSEKHRIALPFPPLDVSVTIIPE